MQKMSWLGVDLHSPASNVRQDVENVITDPENIGDSYIRALLENPEAYNIDKNVVERAVRSFYRLMWSGAGGDQLHLNIVFA